MAQFNLLLPYQHPRLQQAHHFHHLPMVQMDCLLPHRHLPSCRVWSPVYLQFNPQQPLIAPVQVRCRPTSHRNLHPISPAANRQSHPQTYCLKHCHHNLATSTQRPHHHNYVSQVRGKLRFKLFQGNIFSCSKCKYTLHQAA